MKKSLRNILYIHLSLFKDIDLAIFIIPLNGDVIDPDIVVVSLEDDGVVYRTKDPDNEFKYKSEVVESYEEALQKVKENSSN